MNQLVVMNRSLLAALLANSYRLPTQIDSSDAKRYINISETQLSPLHTKKLGSYLLTAAVGTLCSSAQT